MNRSDFDKNKFIYIVLYKVSDTDEWMIFEHGVFANELAAMDAKEHIYQDYHGGVQTRIEKRRLLN